MRSLGFILVLALIALGIAQADLRLLGARGLTPMLSETLASVETGGPPSAAYPPGVSLLLRGLRAAGVWPVDPWIFSQALLTLVAAALYACAALALRSPGWAFLSVLFAILNPYFVWTLLLSRDAAPEVLLLALTLVCAIAGSRSQRSAWPWAVLTLVFGALLGLTRVTGFFTAGAVLAVAAVSARREFRAPWIAGVAGLVICAAGLCAWNALRVGAITLTTTSGYNLYLGNHPSYLDGHPRHDIDVFLSRAAMAEGFDALPEAARDAAFRRRALEFIREDPLAFVYRCAVKSIWHWLNFEKVPSSSADTWLDPSTGLIHTGQAGLLTSLAYLVYRALHIPLFALGLVLLVRRRLPREHWMLLAPMIGLWPLVLLTFPDTRFKIAAEALLCPMLIAAARVVMQRHSQIESAGSADQVATAASGS